MRVGTYHAATLLFACVMNDWRHIYSTSCKTKGSATVRLKSIEHNSWVYLILSHHL